jgi:hypothetical protein
MDYASPVSLLGSSMKLRLFASLAVLLAAVASIAEVAAQPYPSRPVKLIVPYAPGGAGDVIARIVSVQLAKDLGVSVVVENKPGAGRNDRRPSRRERASRRLHRPRWEYDGNGRVAVPREIGFLRNTARLSPGRARGILAAAPRGESFGQGDDDR